MWWRWDHGYRRRALERSVRGGGTGDGADQFHQRPVVKEERALMNEDLDDGLVRPGGCQRVHGLEVRSHERGPEADGEVFTVHQIQLAVLTDSGMKRILV